MSGPEAPARLAGAIDLLPDAFVMLEASPVRRWDVPVVRHHNAAAVVVLGLRGSADGRALDDVCDRTWAARLTDAARRAGTAAVPHRVHDHGPDGEGWLASYDVTAVVAGRDPECVLVVVHDVTHDELVRRRLHDERSVAEHRASHDDLTGLPNRRTVRRELRRMLASCDPARSVGVVFVDLDGFKAVNDRHGHAAGDDVLVAVPGRRPRCSPTSRTHCAVRCGCGARRCRYGPASAPMSRVRPSAPRTGTRCTWSPPPTPRCTGRR